MPVTKNQFLRYDIIHSLLSNRKFNKEDLLEKLNEKLRDKGYKEIGKRTLVYDINYLEEQGAEIHRPNKADREYYYLEQYIPEGSQFDEEDMNILKQAVALLKNIAGFRISRDVEDVLLRLKYTRHIINGETKNLISFEDHTLAAGTEHLDELSYALHMKYCLKIGYKPFAEEERELIFHPYYLKEYRNRWFVFGWNEKEERINNLALDRIEEIRNCAVPYINNVTFDAEAYFDNMIGVTRKEGSQVRAIKIYVNPFLASYIRTKPIHKNQEILETNNDGSMVIGLKLIINYELISVLLGFGDGIRILEPESLRKEIAENLARNLAHYKG
jgi:predicted DNA-binding transcriptional regulator YafY